ncbi:15308_t:CDS:2 [Gigaspora rosea]|nr:15308_t:CDS:2 [Gigaspora rosea]
MFVQIPQQNIPIVDQNVLTNEKNEVFSIKYEPNAFGPVLRSLELHRLYKDILVEAKKDFDEQFVWDKHRSEDLHSEDYDNDQGHKRGYISYLINNITIPDKFV